MVSRRNGVVGSISPQRDAYLGWLRIRVLVIPLFQAAQRYTKTNSIASGYFVLLYYLAIYFQAVLGTSAQQSGTLNLALILGQSRYAHTAFMACLLKGHANILSS
jgi:hypothetical protein